jgi:hypothetical protein
MKSAFAAACLAAISQAAQLEQGYVIDLCPSDEQPSAITMPSTDAILAVQNVLTPSTQYDTATTFVGSDQINRMDRLNMMSKMWKEQNYMKALASQ